MSAGLSSCRLVAVGLLAAAAMLFIAEGRAQALRVAVHVPFIESDTKISEGRRNKFHDLLVTGLKEAASADTTVISGEEVRFALGDKPSLLDCKEGACLHEVAELTKADRLVVAQITVRASVGGSSYKIALAVYDNKGAATQTTGSESCGDESEGCNLNRAFAALKRSTSSIAGQIGGPAKPEPLATAPAPETAAPALKDPTAPPTAGTPRPYNRGYRIGWITSAALTGAFVVASIPFLVYAARENVTTCGDNVPRNQCPTVYTGNIGPGVGLLVGGGVTSAVAFGVLFYLDRKEQRRVAAGR